MIHISEDTLLSYALETMASESEYAEIAAHLEACPECQSRLVGIRRDIGVIAGVRLQGGIVSMPRVRRRRAPMLAILKAAALIIFGLCAGLGTARWTQPEAICVSPAYLALSPPADPQRGSAVSDATAICGGLYQCVPDSLD